VEAGERAATDGKRFSVKSRDNCADRIWKELLTQPGNPLTRRGVGFPESRLIASGAREDGTARPHDWLLVFAIKQVLLAPELCWPHQVRRRMGRNDFLLKARDRILAELPPGIRHPHRRKGNLDALLLTMRSAESVDRAIKVLGTHGEFIRSGLSGLVNEWRGDAARPLGPEELFSADLTGPDAIVRLRNVLFQGLAAGDDVPGSVPKLDKMGWLDAPDSLSGRRFDFLTEGPGGVREKFLSRVCDVAFAADSPLQIVNVHASDPRSDLTALATELFEPAHRIERGCDLPILYLSLQGRSLNAPRDSYPELVHAIWRFYREARQKRGIEPEKHEGPHGRALLDKRLSMPRSSDQTVEMIRAIHQLMAEHPAIIVFDGFRAGRYDVDRRDFSLHNLVSAVAGDRLLDLIDRLAMIPTPDTGGPIDVAGFKRNRFVILSDAPLYEEEPFHNRCEPIHPHPALRLIRGWSVKLPSPTPASLPDLLPMFGLQEPQAMGWIEAEIAPSEASGREALAAHCAAHREQLTRIAALYGRNCVSERIVGLISTLIMLGKSDRWIGREGSGADAVIVRLIRQDLLPLLRQRPVWLRMLHFIAIAPGGLRPKTLARVYEHFEEASGAPQRLGREAINREIAEMLKACDGIVGLGRSDHLEGLSGRPFPLLFRQSFSFGRYEIPSDRAITFHFDEIGRAFVENARDQGMEYLCFLHLLLSEEAYEQFTHLARYDDLQGEESLHRNRRLLTALFHGAASLGNDALELRPLYPGAGRFLPDDPTERWVKLYSFAYRRNLDRPPLHHLVRSFDAGQTKLDILLALARPQLCLETEPPPWEWTLPKLHAPVEAGTAGGAAPQEAGALGIGLNERLLPGILRSFALELRRAARGVSRDLGVDWKAAGLTGDTPQDERVALAEEILGVTEEPDSRARGTDELTERVLAGIYRIVPEAKVTLYLDFVARKVRNILDGGGQLFSPAVERKLGELARVSVKAGPELVKYLSIYGEVLGYRADRDHGAEIARGLERQPSRSIIDGFVKSFAAYYAADFLRNQLFWSAPLGVRDSVSGQVLRGFIRVALKLERFRITLGREAGRPVGPGGWFWRHAHQIADEYARHLSRFPRERLAMLTLDATMARYYESKHDHRAYDGFLTMARECLCSAEPLLLKLGMHNRPRQRFALERNKVMAESARLAIGAGRLEEAARYLMICQADIAAFHGLASPGNLLWTNLAASQHKNLQELEAELVAARTS
jgi:hypothetical protein